MSQFTAPRPQLSLSLRKPRNPLVAPSLLRQAGRHDAASKSQRQQAKTALLKEVRQLVPLDRSP
ncbi:hypothetical protein G8A07_24595 [Roseateles sp. DAIF2]|uniref:hypothetical protein n=1 Tax=Roseateles sp. DAIF2 TaxID=2714952 RepID=UPI0018A2659C|nr:hypothetical protein [Roseateles sp. DAIF2]QPF75782.1 hypothetical protein G8A07_24595 [Roseateles sp. DAIF2]